MKRLVKNGQVYLDGTEPKCVKEKEIFKKFEPIEDLAEQLGIDLDNKQALTDLLKKLKVLDIIKTKLVDAKLIHYCPSVASYNNAIEYEIGYKALTTKEFELLKEIL